MMPSAQGGWWVSYMDARTVSETFPDTAGRDPPGRPPIPHIYRLLFVDMIMHKVSGNGRGRVSRPADFSQTPPVVRQDDNATGIV